MLAGRAAAVALASSCLSLVPEAAQAQVSGRLSFESDYRNRGVSPSDMRRAVILDVDYDHAGGFYAGGSLVAQKPINEGARFVGHSEFAGLARRDADGRSWDVGVSNLDLTTHGYSRLRYSEVYAGVSNGVFSARVHYSPNYLRSGEDIVYLELDGAFEATDVWRVTGHVGAFEPLDQNLNFRVRRRYDAKIALTRQFPRGEVHLSWQKAFPSPPAQDSRFRGRVGVGGSVFF